MIKLALLLAAVGGMILSDPEERAALLIKITYWVSRFVHEGVPLAIAVFCLVVPWWRVFLTIRRDEAAGSVAASVAVATLANMLVGQVLITFDM